MKTVNTYYCTLCGLPECDHSGVKYTETELYVKTEEESEIKQKCWWHPEKVATHIVNLGSTGLDLDTLACDRCASIVRQNSHASIDKLQKQ